MNIRSIGTVGYGSFGALLVKLLKRFAPQIEVRVYSRDNTPDNKTFFSLEDTAESDIVVLAVPIAVFEEVLKDVLPLARQDTILVDVATVKVHTVEVLKRLAPSRRWIATHPMWGPESYEKRGGDVSGFRIVVADHTLPDDVYQTFEKMIGEIGFDIIRMEADDHDKHLAETLFLTHLVGQIIARGDFARTEIDTVSFGYLMNAVESVQRDEALFRDVYTYNPYCKKVLARFDAAEVGVRDVLESVAQTKRKVNGTVIIGVCGAKGSFSEEAALTYVRDQSIRSYTLDYLVTAENVLSALESGDVDVAIFPIENSTGGVVMEAIYAMAKHRCSIQSIFYIIIQQNLLTVPGVGKADIDTITSHEQALKQCRSYLGNKWAHAKIIEYEDTAQAAEDLAKGKLPRTTAVVASKTAASVYGLQVLESSIQDLETNHTTFIAAKTRV